MKNVLNSYIWCAYFSKDIFDLVILLQFEAQFILLMWTDRAKKQFYYDLSSYIKAIITLPYIISETYSWE